MNEIRKWEFCSKWKRGGCGMDTSSR